MANRVLICGGREWNKRELTFRRLDQYHAKHPIDVVIHGAARGADTLAGQWAKSKRIPVLAFPVTNEEWRKDPRGAGHARNQKMLDEGKPHTVIAFPGGGGTRSMKQKARAAGVPVIEMS